MNDPTAAASEGFMTMRMPLPVLMVISIDPTKGGGYVIAERVPDTSPAQYQILEYTDNQTDLGNSLKQWADAQPV